VPKRVHKQRIPTAYTIEGWRERQPDHPMACNRWATKPQAG